MLRTNLRADPDLVYVFYTSSSPTPHKIRYSKITLSNLLEKKSAGPQSSPTERRAKPTGKITGGRHTHITQPKPGMSLQMEENADNKSNKNPEKTSSSEEDDEEQSSRTSENSAPSPKRLKPHTLDNNRDHRSHFPCGQPSQGQG